MYMNVVCCVCIKIIKLQTNCNQESGIYHTVFMKWYILFINLKDEY